MSHRDVKPENMIEPTADGASSSDDVLDVVGAMALLHMSRNTIYEQCARNLIPHRRIGRRIRFSRSALLRWLEGDR
jgi:excisionase family DNA binding protein